jgi:hypothetical protein
LGAAGMVVSFLALTGCITRTRYPADWAGLESGAGKSRAGIAGTYRNLGTHVDTQGARRPVHLTDLLSLILLPTTPPPAEFLAGQNPFLKPGVAPQNVTLELVPSSAVARAFPMKHFRDAQRHVDEANASIQGFAPVLKTVRARTDGGVVIFESECVVLPGGSVSFTLQSFAEHRLQLRLRKASDGALVGRIDDSKGGYAALVLPYFFWSDSWVRFEAAP